MGPQGDGKQRQPCDVVRAVRMGRPQRAQPRAQAPPLQDRRPDGRWKEDPAQGKLSYNYKTWRGNLNKSHHDEINKVHLLESASAPATGTRLSGGVSLAAMRVGGDREGVAWRGGKAVAVDGRGVAHALVVRFEKEPATGRQTTLLLQPCVSPGRHFIQLLLSSHKLSKAEL